MKHFILIDPLEKLTLKKDSTLLFAKALVDGGGEVFFLFPNNFVITTLNTSLEVHIPSFKLDLSGDITSIELERMNTSPVPGDCFHMRLEPPFDSNYLRVLWMLRFIQSKGVRVINDPAGIMNYQEKIFPMQGDDVTPTAVLRNFQQYQKFIENFPFKKYFILKPLDLFQGFGVTKVEKGRFSEIEFRELVDSFGGLVIVQPFLAKVKEGEVRSTFFNGIEIGSILKVPPEGSFLANIAQGAAYKKVDLDSNIRNECKKVSAFLSEKGVPWVAFDLLEDKISEANTTCPGLLYETSNAYEQDLASKIVDLI
jgi:glutathione synthase